MCRFAQRHMEVFVDDCSALMSAADVPRHGEQFRIGMREKLGNKVAALVPRFISMMPGYTPHKYVVPQPVADLSAEFTRRAESAS